MFARSFSKAAAIVTITSLLLAGFGCTPPNDPAIGRATTTRTLTLWGVFDDTDAYQKIISGYRAIHPNVRIEYKKFRPEEYERLLLNALAEDKGPDLFMVRNTAMSEYQNKLLPAPDTVRLPFQEVQGTIRKENVTVLKDVPVINIRQLQSQFVDVVADDVVLNTVEPTTGGGTQTVDRIYGLPLSVDTLALFYNRALLNRAGIPEPPKTWTEVQNAAKNPKLSVFNATQQLVQSAIALGTGKNVERAVDIVQLLMMQNRAPMATKDGNVTFNQRPSGHTGELPPGAEAAVFYTDFANPVKEVYSWNEQQPSSLEAFVGGKTAMFLGYAYHTPLIRARSPKLDFGIAPAPQVGSVVNIANYWVYGVSRKSAHPDESWDFLQFMTAPDQAQQYLEVAQRPTALKALINTQAQNVDLGVFAEQALTAQNWYHGKNVMAMETAFKDLIASTLTTPARAQQWVTIAAQQVAQTYR